MQILSISHMFLTPFDPLDISVFRQMQGLMGLGFHVRVLCPLPIVPRPLTHLRPHWKQLADVPATSKWDGIATWYPRYWAFPYALMLASAGRRMYRAISRTINNDLQDWRFELVHAHVGHPDGTAALHLSRAMDKPLIITLQATDLDITAHRNPRCRRVLHETLRRAARLIAPTPRLANQLLEQFGLEAVVVGYGVDPAEISPGSEELRAKYRNRRVILSVARLMPSKGIDLMIKALPALVTRWADVLYVVVGRGAEESRLKALVRELGMEKHVEFTGQLPHNRVMEYMSVCEAFVLPSWQETFGLVYVEAMAHGKPVVGVLGQGVDGIVTPGKTGLLVPPKDVGALVDAVGFLLDHPGDARTMGLEAKKLVLSEYTWEASATKLSVIYREVVSARCG